MFRTVVVVFAVSLAGCGVQSVSRSMDIAIPGTPNADTKMVWYDQGQAVFGTCKAGGLPNRANCIKVSKVPFDMLLAKLEQDLAAEAQAKDEAYADELSILRNAHPEVVEAKKALADVKREAVIIGAKIVNFERTIARAKEQTAAIAQSVKDYDAQIKAVSDRLAGEPGNAELQRLLDALQQERAAAVVRIAEEESAIRESEAKRDEARQQLAAKNREVQEKQLAYDTLLATASVDSPELQRLKSEMDGLRAIRGKVAPVTGYVRESAFAYRYDLLDAATKGLVDRLIAAINALDGAIKLQGDFQPTLVHHDGEWRAICDDGFDEADAQVICRSVGKSLKGFRDGITHGGKYWLTRLECKGSEKSLRECPAAPWGQVNCDWSEAIAVECE